MNFLTFCRSLGLIIDHVPAPGKWHRCPTEDRPRAKNGAVKWLGDVGFAQNHRTMTEPATWQGQAIDERDRERITRQIEASKRQQVLDQRKAAAKASEMMRAAKTTTHPYLVAKGFSEQSGAVLEGVLLVPMRVGSALVGVQRIDIDGSKKFLHGQRSSGAVHVMGQGDPIYCEGYATGLSIWKCVQALKVRRSVVVCFSASNIPQVARAGLVIADNDESGTGERVARATGLAWWMPETVGEDFNDYWRRVGTFQAAMMLRDKL